MTFFQIEKKTLFILIIQHTILTGYNLIKKIKRQLQKTKQHAY